MQRSQPERTIAAAPAPVDELNVQVKLLAFEIAMPVPPDSHDHVHEPTPDAVKFCEIVAPRKALR